MINDNLHGLHIRAFIENVSFDWGTMVFSSVTHHLYLWKIAWQSFASWKCLR